MRKNVHALEFVEVSEVLFWYAPILVHILNIEYTLPYIYMLYLSHLINKSTKILTTSF